MIAIRGTSRNVGSSVAKVLTELAATDKRLLVQAMKNKSTAKPCTHPRLAASPGRCMTSPRHHVVPYQPALFSPHRPRHPCTCIPARPSPPQAQSRNRQYREPREHHRPAYMANKSSRWRQYKLAADAIQYIDTAPARPGYYQNNILASIRRTTTAT